MREQLRIIVDFKDIPKEMPEILDDLRARGGTAIRCTFGSVPLLAEISSKRATVSVPETSLAPDVINRTTFNGEPEVARLTQSWQGRAWKYGQQLEETGSNIMQEPSDGNGLLDLNLVLAGMRSVEAGETTPPGKTAWNTFGPIINRRLGGTDAPDLVLSWMDDIHPQLRNGPERRVEAAERLEGKYQEYEQSFQASTSQQSHF